MDDIDPVRRGFGLRLKAARMAKGMNQTEVGAKFGVDKGTVSAWETGRGDPGVFRLRELAKLYDVSADALLWENSLSNEAMQIAAQFDGLNEREQRRLRVLWDAMIRSAVSDADVEDRMPITRPVTQDKT